MSITQSNPSITHTFGNAACIAMDYIKSFFTEGYFKKEHISTKLAHRQLDVFRADKKFWKNHKPMLVLRPRVDFDGTSNYFYGSTMMSRASNSHSNMEFAAMVDLMDDVQKDVSVKFIWNRYRIIYDIAIVVETYNEQMNIMNDLRNQLNIDAPWPIKTYLEAYLPKTVVYSVADYVGINRNDIPGILEYLNTISKVPVTYKLHGSSGNYEFFIMYPTTIESFCTDLQPDDGETRGIITDTYTIGFSLSLEFNAVAVWYTFLNDSNNYVTRAPADVEYITGPDGRLMQQRGDRIDPVTVIPLRYDLGLDRGWKILTSTYFYTDSKCDEMDITDISSLLDMPSLKSLVSHHRGNHIPIEPFLDFKCYCSLAELPRGVKGFDIDYDKKCIYVYHPISGMPYRLFVLINSMAINNMAIEITNFNKK